MKHIILLVFVVLFIISGCAAKEEPVSIREPKNLITRENYDDLKTEPKKKEPVEVDYKKEGTYRQNFEPLKQ